MRSATTPEVARPPATTAAALWGAVLPIAAGHGAGDDFEARVEAAWRHLKAAYFAVEELDRLRRVLGAVIADEIAGRKPTPSTTTP